MDGSGWDTASTDWSDSATPYPAYLLRLNLAEDHVNENDSHSLDHLLSGRRPAEQTNMACIGRWKNYAESPNLLTCQTPMGAVGPPLICCLSHNTWLGKSVYQLSRQHLNVSSKQPEHKVIYSLPKAKESWETCHLSGLKSTMKKLGRIARTFCSQAAWKAKWGNWSLWQVLKFDAYSSISCTGANFPHQSWDFLQTNVFQSDATFLEWRTSIWW